MEKMGYSYEDTKVAVGEVSARGEEVLNAYMGANYPEITEKYRIAKCYLPWRRMFEVGLIIEEKKKSIHVSVEKYFLDITAKFSKKFVKAMDFF